MSERQGVEIDYCPECRGIWLDRGELDKILERAKTESEGYGRQPEPAAPQQDRRYDQDRGYEQERGYAHSDRDRQFEKHQSRDQRRDGYGDPRYAQRKKKSPFEFLGDLFE